jgi:hypothetical protein
MTLRELLADAAGQFDDVGTSLGPDGTVMWSRGGRPFASVDPGGAVAEFALDPAVAAAAARTPDVRLSGRGEGWVSFAPEDLDDHAADRAVAWLASAHRRLDPRDCPRNRTTPVEDRGR